MLLKFLMRFQTVARLFLRVVLLMQSVAVFAFETDQYNLPPQPLGGQWRKQYPNLSQADWNETSEALKLWYGEDYGFTDSENFVTISNTCFGK